MQDNKKKLLMASVFKRKRDEAVLDEAGSFADSRVKVDHIHRYVLNIHLPNLNKVICLNKL